MSVRHAVVALCVVLLACVVVTGVTSQSCSKLTTLTTCFPDFQKYMERGVNLSLVYRAFTGGAENINKMCGRFQNLTSCVENKMRSCSSVSDASTTLVQHWDRSAEGIKFLCVDNRQTFLSSQNCLTKPEVISGGQTCDKKDDGDHRRKRHTCKEYETEVSCSDAVVSKNCGDSVAKLTGKLTRLFLKNTPHTNDCAEPGFTSGGSQLFYSASLMMLATAFFAASLQ
jgi:hypothetical protein